MEVSDPTSEEERLRQEIARAWAEMALAKSAFDHADPESVDHAIAALTAAEEKLDTLYKVWKAFALQKTAQTDDIK